MKNIVEFDKGNVLAFESSQRMEGQTLSYETCSADCDGILIKSKGEGIANSAVRWGEVSWTCFFRNSKGRKEQQGPKQD